MEFLQRNEELGVTTDTPTSLQMESYMTVTLQFIDERNHRALLCPRLNKCKRHKQAKSFIRYLVKLLILLEEIEFLLFETMGLIWPFRYVCQRYRMCRV